jgi:hypothetical protein
MECVCQVNRIESGSNLLRVQRLGSGVQNIAAFDVEMGLGGTKSLDACEIEARRDEQQLESDTEWHQQAPDASKVPFCPFM